MKRKFHLLKPNKKTAIPTNYIFFDTETDPVKIDKDTYEERLKLGTAVYWRRRQSDQKDTEEWFSFTTIKGFWDWVGSKVQKKSRIVLSSHNLSFDIKVLQGFKELRDRGYKIDKIILNHKCNIWRFQKGSAHLLFLDNLNFFSSSLKQLGKSVGLAKKEMPVKSKNKKIWFEYCKRDTEIILYSWKKWLKFITDNDLGNFGLTLAAQALNAFRHRFNPVNFYIHNNEKATKLERESYHGGRTECFYIGKLPEAQYYDLDINSAYSISMHTYEYPINLRGLLQKATISDLRRLLKSYCVIARVDLDSLENIFPYRDIGELIFPIGKFTSVLTSRELQYALDHNYIKKVYDLAIYDKAKVFANYVDFFYNKRKEYKAKGQPAFSFMSKILLNSLYGKFGQQNDVYEKIDEDPEAEDHILREWDVEEQRLITYRIINGEVEKSVGKEEAFNSFPGVSSHITADTRLLLYSYIKKAGKENVYYCDTDSLFVNEKGYQNLKSDIQPGVLGKLKIENQGSNLEIRGLKDYTFGKVNRIKGIRKDAEEIDENHYRQWQFEGMRGALHYERLNKMIIKRITKTLYRDYLKGIVNENGVVTPIKL